MQLTFLGGLFNLISFNRNTVFRCVIDTQNRCDTDTYLYTQRELNNGQELPSIEKGKRALCKGSYTYKDFGTGRSLKIQEN